MPNTHVSAIILFHKEGYYAAPALKSMLKMVDFATANGLTVETIAILDNSDSLTDEIASQYSSSINNLIRVKNGDPGLNRNHALQQSKGEFVTFLDGDDLWGEHWIYSAHQYINGHANKFRVALHPEFLYFFHEGDFDAYSSNRVPHPHAKSRWFRHVGSTDKNFPRKSLLLDNVWSANLFAHRSLYEEFSNKPIDRLRGFGIEDWSWNLETVFHGIEHEVVPDTVHLIRVKETGSHGSNNALEGILPYLPDEFMATKF